MSTDHLKQKLEAGISFLFKKGVASMGLLSWWEEHVPTWPRVIFYHSVAVESPTFLDEITVSKELFLEQIFALRQRYRFLTWQEFKEGLASPEKAKRSILLTFDDGFRNSWSILNELSNDHKIPAVFFVNTRVLENAYAPWPIQYYFLRKQADGKFLEPLWKSISNGKPLSPSETRKCCHECFSLHNVVEPIEEGLAKFGLTPAELAQQYRLYVDATEFRNRNSLIEIGNHSHSHYILSKLSDLELAEDLRMSHQRLIELLGAPPDCFAYPFGIPGEHFDERCLTALRSIAAYPYIFAAINTATSSVSAQGIGRTCLDKVHTCEVIETTARVTPRTLKNWLIGKSSTNNTG